MFCTRKVHMCLVINFCVLIAWVLSFPIKSTRLTKAHMIQMSVYANGWSFQKCLDLRQF